MNAEQIAKLKRAIDCLEILDKRPRPMCRDCADEDGTCPTDSLDCDMRKLIADTRAILAAAAPQAQDMEPSDGEIYEAYSKRADPVAHQAALNESLALLPPPASEQGELRERVARAIWNLRREEEDRCDMELEDMGDQHSVWAEADAAIAANQKAADQVAVDRLYDEAVALYDAGWSITDADTPGTLRQWATMGGDGATRKTVPLEIWFFIRGVIFGYGDKYQYQVRFSGSQQVTEPVARMVKYIQQRGRKGTITAYMPFDTELTNVARIIEDVPLYATPAIQQPQDERAAFLAWQREQFNIPGSITDESIMAGGHSECELGAWMARAALAKKGGAA